MDYVTAVSIQYAAQIVERAADIDVGDVNVSVLMRFLRLMEAFSLPGRGFAPLFQHSGPFQHSIHTAGTHGYLIRIEHHICQTTIAFIGML